MVFTRLAATVEDNGMYKTAFIFPGQGSQYVGMGKDWYESSSEARAMFAKANEILGFDIAKICFEGPEDDLRQTSVTQPAIFLHSAIIFSLAKNGSFSNGDADAMAGHSLGEYSALYAAGALDFESALSLVGLRGKLMQEAGTARPGTMAAVVGLDEKTIEEICSEASKDGVVCPANYNSPGQIVISGDIANVRNAMAAAKSHGAKIVKELVVSGAFHSPLMESAKEKLGNAINNVRIRDAGVPVYANVSAAPVTDAEEIGAALVRQLTNPVRWRESVQNMSEAGIVKFVEIGPGKVLQGLVKRTVPSAGVAGVDRFDEVRITVK